MDVGLKRELEAKVFAGERLSREDGEALYASDDLAWLGVAGAPRAHPEERRQGLLQRQSAPEHDERVFSFLRVLLFPAQAGGEGRVHDAHRGGRRLAKAMEPDGITELHIVNGLHPTLPWRYYPRVASAS